MISVIICSGNKDISNVLRKNIVSTIGVEYEIIVIDNTSKRYSICAAYNRGVANSKGDILCFMHDDVLLHTQNWGRVVNSHFTQNPNLGCIGVVGTHFFPNTVCGWYHPLCNSGGCIQLYNGTYINMIDSQSFNGNSIVDAVAVDGMWFCIKRDFFRNHSFDDKSFTDFHCYDIDICFQILQQGLKVGIISNVIISHDSFGSFNSEWYRQSEILHSKWRYFLPVISGISLSEEEMVLHTKHVQQTMVWIKAYGESQDEIRRMRNSRAYRIGKLITSPIKKIFGNRL